MYLMDHGIFGVLVVIAHYPRASYELTITGTVTVQQEN